MARYDVIVIGSGVGGLITANLLAKEGYKVCVLEKNKQVGGALQVYVRNRVIFDTGVHYIGGLEEGQNLYQIFKYLGIIGKLKLKKMDVVFDKILIEGDDNEYKLSQGYENFVRNLIPDFPAEEKAIRQFCEKLKEICGKFPLYNLRSGGSYEEKADIMDIDTKAYLETITDNPKLQAVLAGNNLLYAGQPDKTPFYVHALILNSYIESCWKCVDGGSQIAKLLRRNIHDLGGVVKIHAEVDSIVECDGKISHVTLKSGEAYEGDIFISNAHPAQTLNMLKSSVIRNSFRNRVSQLENSASSFTVDIILKPDCFPVMQSNYYYHRKGQVWNGARYKPDEWPLIYGVFMPAYSSGQGKPGYARAVSLLTYMRYEEVAKWAQTFNTVSAEEERGNDYNDFKTDRAERLIDLVGEKFPTLRQCIDHYYTATPLSYRDYMGTADGTMYGIVKDYRDPLKTMVSPRTKLPNFYFTGQNLNMHGILGAAMSAISTCNSILDSEELTDRIRNA